MKKIDLKEHPAYQYTSDAIKKKTSAPCFVILQCKDFLNTANGKNKQYIINMQKVEMINGILDLLIMPKGLRAGETIRACLSGFQWFLIIAVMCTVHSNDTMKRRYEKVILEIARKNGKTFLVAVIMILLFFMEPRFSKFYSVAPDGSLSREVKTAIEEIISSSPSLNDTYENRMKFKIRRDDILCNLTDNKYIPLNYSNSRLDGKLPSVYLVDEVGALPNSYAIEAMSSGQLTIKNKLGFIISTKYPTINNPFESEVEYVKKVLNKSVEDDKIFALLYEPDKPKNWATDDMVLKHANPLALEVTEMMNDLLYKRQIAIEVEQKRENFITKHCNIIYAGIGTESYVSVNDLQQGKRKTIDWRGREVYCGMDLSMSNDNCSIGFVAWDENTKTVLVEVIAFIPEERIEEKSKFERLNYRDMINNGQCIACGNRTIDYAVIEEWCMNIEKKFGVTVMGIAFDRYNAISSAQKLERAGYTTVEVAQHSSVLHPPTKWLAELIADGKLLYTENKLMEINFQNAKCTYDTNLNRYVTKKKSSGKVDEVIAIINALYLLQQAVQLNATLDWGAQM